MTAIIKKKRCHVNTGLKPTLEIAEELGVCRVVVVNRLHDIYEKFIKELFPDLPSDQVYRLAKSKGFEAFLLGQFDKLNLVKVDQKMSLLDKEG